MRQFGRLLNEKAVEKRFARLVKEVKRRYKCNDFTMQKEPSKLYLPSDLQELISHLYT